MGTYHTTKEAWNSPVPSFSAKQDAGEKGYADTLTKYSARPIAYLRRVDCDPMEGVSVFMRNALGNIPNQHAKRPDVKQRTPNLAADNICLYKKNGEICTVLGFFDKEVTINGAKKRLQGWTMSGGHMEYHADTSLEECAFRELEEEFTIPRKSIVRSMPIAFVDDVYRDVRNEYLSLVFLHWTNQPPRPSDEHKTVVEIPLSKLSEAIRNNGFKDHNNTFWPFLHGHDSILAAVLGLDEAQAFIGKIMNSF